MRLLRVRVRVRVRVKVWVSVSVRVRLRVSYKPIVRLMGMSSSEDSESLLVTFLFFLPLG